MENTMMQQGTFCWNELMTSDVAGAKAFYAELLGWEMHDLKSPETMPYTLLRVGQREVGGIMAFPPGHEAATPAWGTYVEVDDVEKQMARVEQLGGKVIVPPTDIPNVGRIIVISDPQGAMMTLITHYKK
jgi:predicted enzyme related to lactoylglutathione lyase